MTEPKLTKLELQIMEALWTRRQASIRDKSRKGAIRSRFDLQPGQVTSMGITLKLLIELAHGVEGHQISGGPNWHHNTCRNDLATPNSNKLHSRSA
jgi:uncharacterized protein (TIGR03435 family)